MARLDGRVAIVTGGARSIGAAFAKGLAAEGAKIVIADLDAAEETLGIIKQAGGEAMAVKTDVTNESSCEEMVAKAVEAYGKLDILVANAGLWVHLERQDSHGNRYRYLGKGDVGQCEGCLAVGKGSDPGNGQEQLWQDHHRGLDPGDEGRRWNVAL